MRVLAWVLVLLLSPLAQAFDAEDSTFTSHDGTQLRIRTYTPDGEGPFPAILLTHGWNEDIDDANPTTYATRYVEQGYLVVTYDSRGWGRSGGEVELNGPNEVRDAQALIDHIASMDVLLDGPGDPRIGMVGQSYAGGIQFLAAQDDPRIDAIAPTATWSDLLHSLAPSDVIKRSWVDLLFVSGHGESRGVPVGSTDPGAYDPTGLDPAGGPSDKLNEWYAEAVLNNAPSDDMREEVGVVRSLRPGALDAPTFLVQGWPDTLFTPEDALRTFHDLRSRGVDARIALAPIGHGGFGGYNDNETIMPYLDDFLAQHLKDQAPTLPPYPVLRHRYGPGDLVGELQWPPAGTVPQLLYLTDDGLDASAGPLEAELTVPPAPAQCTEVSNFQDQSGPYCPYSADGTAQVFATGPLEAGVEVTGAPKVLVHASSTLDEMFLFFQLVDIDAEGTEQPVLHQVKPVRAAGDAGTVLVDLHTISRTFDAGHRIGIKISTTDLSYHGSREAGSVTLQGSAAQPSLAILPTVADDRHGDRMAPRISRDFDVTMLEGNGTTTFDVVLGDDLALGNWSITGDRAEVVLHVLEDGARSKRIQVRAGAAQCGVALVHVQAEDLAGREATRSWDVVPCVDAAPEEDLEVPQQGRKSPAPLVLLPLALAAWLRRR